MEEKYGIFQPQDNTPYFQVLFKKKEVLLETSEPWVEIEIKADPLRKKWDMDCCWEKLLQRCVLFSYNAQIISYIL